MLQFRTPERCPSSLATQLLLLPTFAGSFFLEEGLLLLGVLVERHALLSFFNFLSETLGAVHRRHSAGCRKIEKQTRLVARDDLRKCIHTHAHTHTHTQTHADTHTHTNTNTHRTQRRRSPSPIVAMTELMNCNDIYPLSSLSPPPPIPFFFLIF